MFEKCLDFLGDREAIRKRGQATLDQLWLIIV